MFFKKRIIIGVYILKKTAYSKYYSGLYNGSKVQTSPFDGNNIGFTKASNRLVPAIRASRFACDPDDGVPSDPAWLDWNIRRRGSHIYFYEEVNELTQMILEVMLRDAVRDVLTSHVGEILGGELSESVTIHINSPGGYLNCGMALYDYIKTSQIPITCLVEGFCASAATLIMLACHNRIMSPNSVFLMHQCSWGAWGENRLMQDLAVNSDKAMKRLRKIYMEETKIGADRGENREAYIQHLLEHDFEFDSTECENLGICTTCDDEDEDVELSDERVEKLQEYIKKLATEQKKENAKKAAEEKKPSPEKKSVEKKKKEPKKPKETKTTEK